MQKRLGLFLLIFILSATGCGAPGITSDNPAVVTFQFEHKGSNVLTWWRKIENGQKGSRFQPQTSGAALALNMSYGSAQAKSMTLDPGLYYLDSFEFKDSGNIYVSEAKHFLLRNGWDDGRNKPFYLSFEVTEGQHLVLPVVNITVDGTIIRFKFEDPDNIFAVGERVFR